MLRDIDYAAVAVKTALVEKFGREAVFDDLQVTANERTISVQHGQRTAEGTRDFLITILRKAGSYEQFWRMCADAQNEKPLSIRG
ncbi:MAG TPA: hypothetical protein VFE46_11185 [Pirellulales bacterium]|jgi:hypothetical protein|nr:hypothetical protein [Pirellulales bacterium]